MITVHWVEKEPNQSDWEYEFYGLSTDPKPDDLKIAVNSILCELDTGDFYYLKSKKSSSLVRETLIEEQSFTGVPESSSVYGYTFYNANIERIPDEIIVNFDGAEYTAAKRILNDDSVYGASIDEHYNTDFSEYPFVVYMYYDDNDILLDIAVGDGNEHTVEIRTEYTVTVEAVWNKVGTGGDTPVEEGYEINNPVLTVTVERADSLDGPLMRYFVDDDGYLSAGQITPNSGGDVYTSIVFYDDDSGYYEYPFDQFPNQASNTVNCIYDDYSGTVYITDQTEDASITVKWEIG